MSNCIPENNSNAIWNDNGNIRNGRYTSCFKNSYFLKNIEEILYNLDNGNDYYMPKKGNIRLLKSDNFLTIIEGIGIAFLNMDEANSLRIFLQCDSGLELERRKLRKGNSLEQNDEQTNKLFEERNSQFNSNVLPYINKFNWIVKNDVNYNYIVKKKVNKS